MAGVLSIEERAKIASRYEVWQSVVQVQRWWRAQNGRNASLNARTIKNCHSKLFESGSVKDKKRSGRRPTASREENVNNVQAMFERSPKKSVRQGARESGLTRYAVNKILKKILNFRPWKPNYVQQLFLEDCDIRMEFSEVMLAWKEESPNLFNNILWSDEAVFHVGGFVNRHNCHWWSAEKPGTSFCIERMQTRPKLTVWCGFTANRFIGPFILHATMNSERYLNMLQTVVWPEVSAWDEVDDIIFMQDGATPHYANTVRDWLNTRFTDKWIGRGGPHHWPARSPDLTPCDFFLWGWAKEEVYKRNPKTLQELEAFILDVLGNVPQDFLRKSVQNVSLRLRKCVDNAGAYVEV